jgi:hypothetical protein
VKLALVILLFGVGAFAADTAKCVRWERTERTSYEWDGKKYKSTKSAKRNAVYDIGGKRIEVESADTDAAEKSSVEAKNYGKPVVISKGKP